ncbi:MAG: glycosyltransferase family 2 protein [Acidobacteria bacterium]|nr:glycosyltransferase family 2 protein [Acidobacteriota bacterium]MDA1235612.1 glycosyltransferase family 2 protein [Acidobacteriota bacterium]
MGKRVEQGLGSAKAWLWRWQTRAITSLGFAATARRVKVLRPGASTPASPESLVVVCLMRDAGGYVDSYIEHYRRLGAVRIVLLDNGSTDDSVERAMSYDGVTVLRCELPFRWFRTAMRRYLVETYGDGGWVLLADVDELWDYPFSEGLALGSFLQYLNEHSDTAVAAQMLDLFAPGPVDGWPDAGPELVQAATWFDLSDVRKQELPAAALRNRFAAEAPPCFNGGLRMRAFSADPLLTKFPLTRRENGRGPLVENAHFVSGASVADVTCVLLHYKFDGRFRERTEEAVRRKNLRTALQN